MRVGVRTQVFFGDGLDPIEFRPPPKGAGLMPIDRAIAEGWILPADQRRL